MKKLTFILFLLLSITASLEANDSVVEPEVEGSGSSQPEVEGSSSAQPEVEGSSSSQPEVEGSSSAQPEVEGSSSAQPEVEGSSSPQEDSTTTTELPDYLNCEGECPAKDPVETSVYLVHWDCQKFCQCSNGRPIVLHCPENLHFNREWNVCDWPDSANCTGIDTRLI